MKVRLQWLRTIPVLNHKGNEMLSPKILFRDYQLVPQLSETETEYKQSASIMIKNKSKVFSLK